MGELSTAGVDKWFVPSPLIGEGGGEGDNVVIAGINNDEKLVTEQFGYLFAP